MRLLNPQPRRHHPEPQQQQEEKAKLERKANALLGTGDREAQSLKLPENPFVSNRGGRQALEHNAPRARGRFVDAGGDWRR